MMETGKCPKCGAAEIVPDAHIVDGHYSAVVARADARPDAMIFRDAELCQLYARVCGQCGFTELYARKPQKLYEAHRKAEAERRNPTW